MTFGSKTITMEHNFAHLCCIFFFSLSFNCWSNFNGFIQIVLSPFRSSIKLKELFNLKYFESSNRKKKYWQKILCYAKINVVFFPYAAFDEWVLLACRDFQWELMLDTAFTSSFCSQLQRKTTICQMVFCVDTMYKCIGAHLTLGVNSHEVGLRSTHITHLTFPIWIDWNWVFLLDSNVNQKFTQRMTNWWSFFHRLV